MISRKIAMALVLLLTLSLSMPARSEANSISDKDPTLRTDKKAYLFYEVVYFSGDGYFPGGTQYAMDITKGSEVIAHIPFVSTSSGEIPAGTEWEIPSNMPVGFYTATAYNYTDPDNPATYKYPVAETTFLVNAVTLLTDKEHYVVEETVNFYGIGYVPGETKYLLQITFGSEIIHEIYFISEKDGSMPQGISWHIPFEASNGTYLATVYNDTEPSVGVPLAIAVFNVNATIAGRIDGMYRELDDLSELVDADVEGMSKGLLMKLRIIEMKINQSVTWLEGGKNKTAVNMLKAARNNLVAFINHIEAQRGKHIHEETADILIEIAEMIIDKIDQVIQSINQQERERPSQHPENLEEKERGKNEDTNGVTLNHESHADRDQEKEHEKKHDKDKLKPEGQKGKGKGKERPPD